MISQVNIFYIILIILHYSDQCLSLLHLLPGRQKPPANNHMSPALLRKFPGLTILSDVLGPSLMVPKVQALAESLLPLIDDGNYTVEYLIESHGYPVEVHHITTTDGYILAMYRIPNNKTKKCPVFLQHGLFNSAADWLIQGPGKSIAFILFDRGYDVWMGNARGNTYSRKHISLSPDDPRFWQFSWHEIGVIDVPQMIDYVLDQTNTDQVYYIGHSQGTTAFYVMTSCIPEFNKKIKVSVSLAPIAFMNHLYSPILQFISRFEKPVEVITPLIGLYEFSPNTALFKIVASDILCREDAVTQLLCTNALFAIAGFSRKQMNTTLLPLLLKYTPAGASTHQVFHYAQEINSGKFCQYDFGLRNLVIYGRSTPINYDISRITAPNHLLYGNNDWLAAKTDIKRLCSGMGKACKETYKIKDEAFNHVDFLYGIDARKLVYNKTLCVLDQY